MWDVKAGAVLVGIIVVPIASSPSPPKATTNASCMDAGGSKCVGRTGGKGSAALGMPIDSTSLLRALQVAWH